MMNKILYISYEEVCMVYQKTIEKSGGGFSGILNDGGIKSTIDFIQDDRYYPDFVAKVSYLVFQFCSGHFFTDGNKRIAITIGCYFLQKNGHYWAATQFLTRMEAIIYHIAASNIDKNLLLRIMTAIVECKDFDEDLQIDIANAIDVKEDER